MFPSDCENFFDCVIVGCILILEIQQDESLWNKTFLFRNEVLKLNGIQGVAINKPDSCSNPLLKKIRPSKCYPLQCSPLPDPYTAPCEFSTVGGSAAGHLVLCCLRVASLLLSLHPRTRTWFLWAQTWFSGREKCRTVLGPEGTRRTRQIPLHR